MKSVRLFGKSILLFWAIAFASGLSGCSDKENTVYNNKSFEDIKSIAESDKKPFCLVLTDSSQNLSKLYLSSLKENYNNLTQKAIYNIVDINVEETKWLMKWLMPPYIPLTCIFSYDGILIDVIPGMSKETFLYSEKAITLLKATAFHWPNNFHKNKQKVISYLNQLLDHKKNIALGVYKSSGFDNPVDSLNYPYAVYLKLDGALKLKDTANAIQAAKSLLELEDPSVFELFSDEFMTAKKIVTPNFNLSDEANIKVNKTQVLLENCKVNEKYPISLIVFNDGKRPLKIKGINLSCTCLSLEEEEKEIIIKGKEQQEIKVIFTPNDTGKLSRDIFITSNAINTQNLHINVQAYVKN